MADLAHAVHGPRDGPVVVLLHGFPFDRAMWRFQLGALTGNGYRVVLPDLPGAGQTDVDAAATVDSMADDVERLLVRLKIGKATVVGFSMGGYVALAFAVRHASKLAGLVLIDTRSGADTAEAKAKRDATITDVQAHGVRGLATGMLPKQLTETTRTQQRLLVDEVRAMMLRQPKAGVAAALGALRDRPDRTDALLGITAPSLVLVGEHDPITPPSDAQAMASALPKSTHKVIPGAAHLTPMEQPRLVTEALLDWLESHAPPA